MTDVVDSVRFASDDAPTELVSLVGVTKHFSMRARNPFSRTKRFVHAVDDVNLSISRGTTLGLVGESGSGKSTLARLVVGLIDVTSGSVAIEGRDLKALSAADMRHLRRDVQMVFQDPYSSFDPTSPLWQTVLEPLDAAEHNRGRDRHQLAEQLFNSVGLRPALVDRYPSELSGGQLQRAAIARALSTRPKLLVLDEPVSALDVSTQAQIVNLLEDLRDEFGLSYLFVAHDLAVVRHVSDEIAVMYLGQIIEHGSTERVYNAPAHPYTAALLSAVPIADPALQRRRHRVIATGEIPSAVDPPVGCRFRTRCPWAMDVCALENPRPYRADGGVTVFCHLHEHGPRLAGGTVLSLDPPTSTGPS
jgi:peptide/nickel transport system ATP-binding protein